MGKFKKVLTLVIAMLMVVAASSAAFAHTITINNSTEGYSYKAYQIFTGDLSGDTLSNIDWGNGVTEAAKTALYNRYNLTGENRSARKVAEAIAAVGTTPATQKAEADAIATLLAKTTAGALGTANNLTFGSDKYVSSDLASGYYLVVNDGVPANATGTAYSDYIVEVVKNVSVSPKSEVPSSDKTVSDDADQGTAQRVTANGSSKDNKAATDYESVDHELYEIYKYTLTATLPNDNDLDSYATYKLVFNDTMTKGVSFLGNVSVTATNAKANTTISYTLSENVRSAAASAPVAGDPLTWSLTIDDLLQYVSTLKGTVVTVTFDAYLNANALVVGPGPATDSNDNTYYLEYSNNPNSEGLGKTVPDTVYTFAYTVPNTKYANDTDHKLPNAGFSILSGNTTLKFVPIDTDGVVVTTGVTEATSTTAPVTPSTVVAYRLAKEGEAGALSVIGTLSNGKFDVKGLDAGTYTLREVYTPEGYNTADDSTIIVTGDTTEESKGGKSVMTMTQDGKESTDNGVINMQGSTLPSTGGMGTTIFYVIGGILILAAAIILISRRRVQQ